MWLPAASNRFSDLCLFAKWTTFFIHPRSWNGTSLKNGGLKKGSEPEGLDCSGDGDRLRDDNLSEEIPERMEGSGETVSRALREEGVGDPE